MSNLPAEEMTARRLTPTERLHDLARAAIERQRTTEHPSFSVSQVKAVGGATVMEWDVRVPVCDEYPDAEKAFSALTGFADRLLNLYPPAALNGGTSADTSSKDAAKKAAAIATAQSKAKGAAS